MNCHITVFPQEQIGVIHPFLHGQFVEHLGEQIYPGIIHRDGSLRNDVLEALYPLHISTIRWPGGCFADTYHWQEAIGKHRRVYVNENWGFSLEPSAFGMHEYMQFMRLLGAEPYIAANVGSGTVKEFHDWVEYANCHLPTSMSQLRAQNGQQTPFNIRYWGIGNESWGCGGNFTPEGYAEKFLQFTSFGYYYNQIKIEAIAAGANHKDWEWTQRFFAAITAYESKKRISKVSGYSIHYYSGRSGPSAIDFTQKQWLELISKATAIEGILLGHRQIIDQYDVERKVKLIIDEWGTWHPQDPSKQYRSLYQQNSMRDAMVAAVTLDIFHNNADIIHMANIAQMINVLQSLVLVSEKHVIKTPTYHVFDLYQAHKNGKAVNVQIESPVISDGENAKNWCESCFLQKRKFELRMIGASASIKGNILTLTMTNRHHTTVAEVYIALYKAYFIDTVDIEMIFHPDIHAHNTEIYSEEVYIRPKVGKKAEKQHCFFLLPPASITKITCKISMIAN